MPTTEVGRLASGRAADAPRDLRRPRPVIVVGAGTGGHYLLPALDHGYRVLGFVDDNADSGFVHGHPVLGTTARLGKILEDQARRSDEPSIEQVIFAIPTATGSLRLRVLEEVDRFNRAYGARVAVVSLPSMFELRHGHPLQPQLRPFGVHETFGDRPWLVDRHGLRHVCDRRVVIVGAANALGAELARRVALARPRHLVLIDENAVTLRDLAAEIRDLRGLLDCDERILDVAAPGELMQVLDDLPSPDVVFFTGGVGHASTDVLRPSHAARANVLAAFRTAEAARAVNARDVVLASVDRAAHRASEFDMTKALGESAALLHATDPPPGGLSVAGEAGGMRVSVLRMPNLWSRDGAVTGRLLHQLSRGGPLRVKASRRRFAQAWEAAQTMLRLLGAGHDGGVFALTAGDDVRLRTVAERLLLIHGLVAGSDIPIETIEQADSKAGLLLWGRDELCGAEVVRGALKVQQTGELRGELRTRALDVVEALRAEQPEKLAGPLEPYHRITDTLHVGAIAI